jgi:hypothetical protein
MSRTLASLITITLLLLASIAAADDMGGESIAVPPPAEPAAEYAEPPTASEDDGWRYCTYYILPLTRHMQDSGLPLVGQIFLYPLAAAFDIAQLPVGALAGLAGE